MGTLLETARDMGGVLFAKMLTSAGLEDAVAVSQNATLFVPTDDAMRDFIDGIQDQNRVRRALSRSPVSPVVVAVSDDESDEEAVAPQEEPRRPEASALESGVKR